MATLKLEIVTPEGITRSEDVDMVVLPGVEGEMGILPMHIPLMTELLPGEMKIVKGSEEEYLAVGQGFVEITFDSVSVLTDMAVEESDIDEAEAEAAMQRAQQAFEDAERMGGEELAAVEAAIQKSLAKLNLKRRRRH